MSSDVIIIGAGVAGLMTSIELAEAGLKVDILEAGTPGKESSWAGGGILSPIYPWKYPDEVNLLTRESNKHYPAYLQKLQQTTGIDPEWLSSGHLILNQETSDPSVQGWLEKFPQAIENIDTDGLSNIEPNLTAHTNQALWLPEIGQVRNPRFIRALEAYALKVGIVIHKDQAVTEICPVSGLINAVKTTDTEYRADTVIICAGAWSSSLLPENNHLQITPVKGQMILFQTTPGSIQRIVLHEGRYIIPRKDGKVLVGSTMEYTGFEKSTNPETKKSLSEFAQALFPVLTNAPIVKHWSGLRPGNERQTPYICRHPEISNLYYNTGHFRNGITTGLASAMLCANLVTGGASDIDSQLYAA